MLLIEAPEVDSTGRSESCHNKWVGSVSFLDKVTGVWYEILDFGLFVEAFTAHLQIFKYLPTALI